MESLVTMSKIKTTVGIVAQLAWILGLYLHAQFRVKVLGDKRTVLEIMGLEGGQAFSIEDNEIIP